MEMYIFFAELVVFPYSFKVFFYYISCPTRKAWFCKHLKYCGTDASLAQEVVGPDEEASDLDDEAEAGGHARKYTKRGAGSDQSHYYRDSADRLRITGELTSGASSD